MIEGTDLEKLIREALSLKRGDREFALFFSPEHQANWITGEIAPDSWLAEIGNENHFCGLGEVRGEYCGEGPSPEEAVMALIKNMVAGRRND